MGAGSNLAALGLLFSGLAGQQFISISDLSTDIAGRMSLVDRPVVFSLSLSDLVCAQLSRIFVEEKMYEFFSPYRIRHVRMN